MNFMELLKYYFHQDNKYYMCYISDVIISSDEDAFKFMKSNPNFGLGKSKVEAKNDFNINQSALSEVVWH